MIKFFPIVAIAISVLSADLPRAIAAENVDDVKERLTQRGRDLQQQGPLNKDESEYMNQLISKRVLRIANTPEDRKAMNDALRTNNLLVNAYNRSHKSQNGRADRGGSRRTNEYSASSTSTRRELGKTNRKGSKSGGSSKEGSGKSPSGPSVPELVPMVLEAFQDARMVQPPILTTPLASDLEPGTQYMFSNEPLFSVQLDSPKKNVAKGTEGYYVNESDMIATVSGTCTRTDPNTGDMYTGRTYCQFSYRFLDEFGKVEAALVAEGIVQIGDYSTLSITGGTGIFRGTVGTVILESGTIGSGNSPTFVPDPTLDLPSSYLVNMFVFMDPLSLTGQ
ncbi:hypothetical protein IV203_025948 [Nitzschia inconspicua]|uniref:Dirigent protein n=1 Tax=Nitzschia inconspicua TaxID=303405 RepID=A0A9K3PAJ6_9STRA|nr:hypothetical protein IV203_017736 [Nitzschia inconspicua]KAG7362282.1 hypothetical protein IV203_025948 [Nitzschia inconspicua]